MSREETLHSLMKQIGILMKSMRHQGFIFGKNTLSRPQVDILFIMEHHQGGIPVGELAELMKVTSGAVTQFADSLVSMGLVRREEDPADRRILRIKLTPLAEAAFAQFRKDFFTKVSPAFNDLSDEELQEMIRLLRKVKVPFARELK